MPNRSDSPPDRHKMKPASEAEIVEFLSDPVAYAGVQDHVERDVEHMSTHGAHIFLAGDLAIKVKRPVAYDYMDFSTLALRREAIEHELEVNRPNAPDIYDRVVAITREHDGTLRIGGAGEPVEWALIMRRFAQEQLLSHRIADGPLPIEEATAVADAVCASHRRAPQSQGVDMSAYCSRVAGNIARALDAASLQSRRIEQFRATANALIETTTPLLESRSQAGFVRRCHGDLHLSNILLWQGRPTLFDAIEFDDALATIDTLYDLAFLLMDLDRHGARPTANTVLNRYLNDSREPLDLDGLAALPLFLGLRAGVRAMVAAQEAALNEGGARTQALDRAAGYLELALGYLEPLAPRLVAVGGFSGTGKTTLSAALAPDLAPAPGAVHLRSDVLRKKLAGVDELSRLPASAYTAAASARVYAELERRAQAILSAGHSVVVDAVYSATEERAAIERIAHDCSVAFSGLWLTADPTVMLDRVQTRTGDASDATADVVKAQLERGSGDIGWQEIDAGRSPADTLKAALQALR